MVLDIFLPMERQSSLPTTHGYDTLHDLSLEMPLTKRPTYPVNDQASEVGHSEALDGPYHPHEERGSHKHHNIGLATSPGLLASDERENAHIGLHLSKKLSSTKSVMTEHGSAGTQRHHCHQAIAKHEATQYTGLFKQSFGAAAHRQEYDGRLVMLGCWLIQTHRQEPFNNLEKAPDPKKYAGKGGC